MTRSLAIGLFLTAHASAEVDFAHQVAPVLEANCKGCHLGRKAKGEFSMNTRESLLKGWEEGEVLEPGQTGSRFIELLRSKDSAEQMPPEEKKRVAEKDIAILEQWILEGAKWEPGFSFAEKSYEPPLKPRVPTLPPAVAGRTHPIDRILDAQLAAAKVPRPAPLADAAFLRRLTLDLTGLLPTPQALEKFLADPAPDKRARLIAATLADNRAYADHWLAFWNDLLRNDFVGTGYIDGGRKPITGWLYQALLENMPYDRFARELLAPPTPESAGFINGIKWRGTVNSSQVPEVQFAQSVSQTFLGINMKCASCHDSFVDRWKLDEAYGLAAIFSNRPLEIARCDVPTGRTAKAAWIFPELGQVDPGAAQPERLKQLANLMTDPNNGRFARTMVNRLWQRLMGRGIVHPVDAMDTAPWNADLLDALANQFVADGYDLKKAMAFIVSSQAYQSQSIAVKDSAPGYRGPLAKRMSAEQFVDAVWALTGTAPKEAHKSVPALASKPSPLTGKWIWSRAEAATAPAGEALVFATEVNLPSAPTAATAAFSCDNSCTVFINGKAAGKSDNWQKVPPIKIAGLVAGRNTVSIVARNGGNQANPAALFFSARIDFQDGKSTILATDEKWQWSPTLPNAQGLWQVAPHDWQPAVPVADPSVWAKVVPDLLAALATPNPDRPMVRASLVPADLLMRALGRPNREQIVSMRPDNLTTLEAIDLANGEILANLLHRGAEEWAGKRLAPADLVDALFLRALSRPPVAAERVALLESLGGAPDARAIEDLFWMVLLLPEFQFVR